MSVTRRRGDDEADGVDDMNSLHVRQLAPLLEVAGGFEFGNRTVSEGPCPELPTRRAEFTRSCRRFSRAGRRSDGSGGVRREAIEGPHLFPSSILLLA